MVRMEGFEKWYGEIHAVKNLDLEIGDGEFVVASEDDHLAYHLRDVHPNPQIYPDAHEA